MKYKYSKEKAKKILEKYNKGGGVSLPVSKTISKQEIDSFTDYVNEYYGKKGIYADQLDGGFTKAELKKAVNKYISNLDKNSTWGYGDSLDRERVRQILQPSYKLYSEGGYAEKGVKVETLDEEIDLTDDGIVKATKTQQGGNKSFGERREMHGASPEALAFAKGGGVRKVGNREYSTGRNWTNDHNHVNKSEKHEVNYNRKSSFFFAEGGSLGNHGLKQGDEIIKTMSGGVQKVKTKSGDIVYVNLANGYRGVTPPLPFAKGGYTNERRHVNKAQDYEVRYAKPRPNRTGYSGKRSFDDGGEVRKMQLGEPVIYKGETWEVTKKNGVVGLTSMRQGAYGSDFPFVPISKIDARREVKDFYGNEVRIPYLVEDFEEGGYMTDPNFGDFQNGVYATGGGVDWRKYPFKKVLGLYEIKGSEINRKVNIVFFEKYSDDLYFLTPLDRDRDIFKGIFVKSTVLNSLDKGVSVRGETNDGKKVSIKRIGNQDFSYEEGGGVGEKYLVDGDRVLNTETNMYVDYDFETKERAEYFAKIKNDRIKEHGVDFATGGVTKNYINRNQLNTITIKKGNQKLTYKVSDVYNGAYKLEDGGNLERTAFYVSKRNVVKVQLKDGKDVKVANGYWIKKGAKPIHTSKYDDGGMTEKEFMQKEISSQKEIEKGKVFKKYRVNVYENSYPFIDPLMTDNLLEAVNFAKKTIEEQRKYRASSKDLFAEISEFTPIEKRGNVRYPYYTIAYLSEEDLKSSKYDDGGQLEMEYAGGGSTNKKIKINSDIEKIEKKFSEIFSKNRVYIDSIDDFHESDELSITFRSYDKNINVDGLHIGYDKKTKLYQVEELQAGDKEQDIYIYKITPSLTLALKEILKGNNRKPIEVIKMYGDGKKNDRTFEGGGKTTFKEKATAIAKNFEGKKVEPKYQKEYGKTYDKAEAKEVGNKIAGSQKAKYDSKMSGGGNIAKKYNALSKEDKEELMREKVGIGRTPFSEYEKYSQLSSYHKEMVDKHLSTKKMATGGTTKRGGAMQLAKQIRKDGESWQSALKRANEQMRNK